MIWRRVPLPSIGDVAGGFDLRQIVLGQEAQDADANGGGREGDAYAAQGEQYLRQAGR